MIFPAAGPFVVDIFGWDKYNAYAYHNISETVCQVKRSKKIYLGGVEGKRGN